MGKDKISYSEFKERYGYPNTPFWSFYYKYIKRPLTIPLSYALYHTNVKPDTLTYLGFLMALISALFFSLGDKLYLLLGIVFIHLFMFFDDFDGVIARSKEIRSRRGGWLDALLGVFGWFVIYLGMSLGLFYKTNEPLFLIFGMLIILASGASVSTDMYSRIRFVVDDGKKKMATAEESSLSNMGLKKIISICVEFLGNLWHFFLIFAVIFDFMLIYMGVTAAYYLLLAFSSFIYQNIRHKND